MSGCYVYTHVRKDTGRPFYVGKGRGNRAWSVACSGRNEHWGRIVKKHGRVVNIVASGMDDDLAYLVESELIDKLRRQGEELANYRDWIGGRLSGRPVSEDHRKNLSASRRSNMSDPLHLEAVLKSARMAQAATMKPVECAETGSVFQSASEAARWCQKQGSPRAHASAIVATCKGKRPSAYGFKWLYISKEKHVSS